MPNSEVVSEKIIGFEGMNKCLLLQSFCNFLGGEPMRQDQFFAEVFLDQHGRNLTTDLKRMWATSNQSQRLKEKKRLEIYLLATKKSYWQQCLNQDAKLEPKRVR